MAIVLPKDTTGSVVVMGPSRRVHASSFVSRVYT
jgi:hypothetical protein